MIFSRIFLNEFEILSKKRRARMLCIVNRKMRRDGVKYREFAKEENRSKILDHFI